MAGDPYLSQVKLYLNCDGADNGTTFTDWKGHGITRAGNACTKTGIKKYGTASGYFDGNGDYVYAAASADWLFATDPFTIEAFVYLTGDSALDGSSLRYATIATGLSGSGGGFGAFIKGDASATGIGLAWEDKYGGVPAGGNASATISKNEWHHVCWCREGGTVYMGLDGSIIGTSGISTERNLGSSSTSFWVAGQPGVASWYRYLLGHLDEVLLTKGTARYKDTYTVPDRAHPLYDRYIDGTITEDTPFSTWIVRVHRLDTGALLDELEVTGSAYELECMVGAVGYTQPVVVSLIQKCGVPWAPGASKSAGDFVIPTSPIVTPYIYECTTDGTTHASTEPIWGVTPGETTDDGTVVWTCKGRMVKPILNGPLIPSI